MSFWGKLIEFFRDNTRDNYCVMLQQMGINTTLAVRNKAEERIECGIFDKSIGLVEISNSDIRWINMIQRSAGEGGVSYFIKYGVPDSRLISGSPDVKIEAKLKKNTWQWEGKGSDLSIIERLNNDTSAWYPLVETKHPKIEISPYTLHSFPERSCWVISTRTIEDKTIPAVVGEVSLEIWGCYQKIAQHLLNNQLPQ